jgi:hypothetical protein
MSEQQQEVEETKRAAGVNVQELLDHIVEQSERVKGKIELTERGVEFGNYEGILRFARMMVEGGMVPESYLVKDPNSQYGRIPGPKTVPAVALAIIHGRKIGLDAISSVQAIMVVNGIPTIWGSFPLAICMQSGHFDQEVFEQFWKVDGKRIAGNPEPKDWANDTTTAVAIVRRKGGIPYVSEFSIANAKKAGLWDGAGKLYGKYPQRLLPARALGYALKDRFFDLLAGMAIRELGGSEENDDDQDILEPPRSTAPVLDRIAAQAAPHSLTVMANMVAENHEAAVRTAVDFVAKAVDPPKVAAKVVSPPAELAGVVAEVQAETVAVNTTQPELVQQVLAGEPPLAKLSVEKVNSLASLARARGKLSQLAADKLLSELNIRPDATAPGCYSADEVVGYFKEVLIEALDKVAGPGAARGQSRIGEA